MQEKHQFTPKGVAKMRQQAETLENQLLELESQISDAADVGGNQWHDNFSYEQLTQQIRGVNHRLSEVRATLNRASIAERPSGKVVAIGTKVTIKMDNNSPEDWIIVGYGESDPENNLLAYNTPLAQLLIGKCKGDKTEGQLANKIVNIEIQDIEIDDKF